MKHVIIGVGAAGISAAATIRSISKEDEIVMISTDDKVHSRCMLHHFLGHKRTAEELDFTKPGFFTENRIQWIKGKKVTSIDTAAKKVELEGETVAYDTLLIASGANSIIPPVGALRTAKNVYGMRHLADAEKITQKAETAKKVVVIGAGLVGLDAAYGLMELKRQVTVVEMAAQVLPLNLDVQAAAAYQKIFELNGCSFRLGNKVTDTLADDQNNITHIVLDTGEKLGCDMVVVAAGVRPAIEFLEGSGIEAARGIKVDNSLKTSCKDVYAAGDVTGLAEIWPSATRQGKVAATNMCGGSAELADIFAYKNTVNFFGLTTLSVGDSTFKDGGEAVVREDYKNYQKYVTRDNKVTGVVLQGDISHSGVWQYLIKNEVDISQLKKPVWKLSFADFYGTGEKGQYSWA